MIKLIRSLQWAHASELAAFFAYQGHLKSLKDPLQKAHLQWIIDDEEDHIKTLKELLEMVDSRPDHVLDSIGKIVGETIGWLCGWTGWYLPMKVAGLMEKIGHQSYNSMAEDALLHGDLMLHDLFTEMAIVEKEHETYFQEVINETRS